MSAVPQSALVLRRRSGWEAADSGILLWQKNMAVLLCFYGIPLGLLTFCGFFLPEDFITYFGIALWWLKPFFDRFALHVISLRFFQPEARFPRLFRGLGKSLIRGIAGDLLWRRLSPCRSSRMPLIVLEGLKGPPLKKRRLLMNSGGLYFGFPITVICIALNAVLIYGEIAFIYGIFELIQPGFLGDIWDFSVGLTKYTLPLSWINQIFIETIYVCMGFGIYINSRVETEGWDIELLFKKYTEKAAARRRSAGIVKSAAVCLILASVLAPVRVFAASEAPGIQESSALPENPSEDPAAATQALPESPGSPELFVSAPLPEKSAEELKEILASKDFGNEKPGWKIQFKKNEKPDSNFDLTWRDLDFPWLKEVLGIIIRTVITLAVVFVLAWSAGYFYRHRQVFTGGKKNSAAYGIRNAAVAPAELLKKAVIFHAEGRIREAWACCLRAFIAALSLRWGIAFSPETTEYEALVLAGTKNGDFPRFVSRWIAFAYGGKTPEKGAFDESVEACRRVIEDCAAPPEKKRTEKERL
ncbi:MAG: hypothetical protein LBP29_02425 [Treponema sp.]|jgi:hypothetical protein|nr:hypothetical protein [Treponema sp.]